MPLDIRPLVDYAFKKVFGSPENVQALISFLNAVLKLHCPIVLIKLLNPFNDKQYKSDKLSILDIRAEDASGATFLIEVQLTVIQGLIKRWVYYTCKQIASQLVEGENYMQLRPVYTICILDGLLWKESPKVHHRFRLADLESGLVMNETIEIHTLELGKYNLRENDLAASDPLEQWLYWLIHANEYEASELRELFPGEEWTRATEALETIKMKSADYERYLEREKALRDMGWQVQAAHQEGAELGYVKGELVGKIEILHEVLGLSSMPPEVLKSKAVAELESHLRDLRQRMQNRSQQS